AVRKDQAAADLNRNGAPVFRDDFGFVGRLVGVFELASQLPAQMSFRFPPKQCWKLLADELFTRITRKSLGRAIHGRERTVHVVNIKSVFRILKKFAIAFLAFTQSPLGLFARSDVLRCTLVVKNRSGCISDGTSIHRQPDPAAVFAKRFVLEVAHDVIALEQSFELIAPGRIDVNLARDVAAGSNQLFGRSKAMDASE